MENNRISSTPCDTPDENGEHHCPYIVSDDNTGMYFCWEHCGLGVDE